VCGLVAHHSGSRYAAHVRGLDDPLAEFDYQENLLSDALTAADQTIGPHGRPMTVSERIDDMLARHGDDSPKARAHPERGPYLSGAARRVAARMESAGVDSTGTQYSESAGHWPPADRTTDEARASSSPGDCSFGWRRLHLRCGLWTTRW
jgi:hypothetical protein